MAGHLKLVQPCGIRKLRIVPDAGLSTTWEVRTWCRLDQNRKGLHKSQQERSCKPQFDAGRLRDFEFPYSRITWD